jgi:hypothetical protein
MKDEQEILINFYEAVMSNDGVEVMEILHEHIIPVRFITGILMIALESELLESAKAILAYNVQAKEKIKQEHLDNILYFAAKNHLLKKLDISYN